MIRKVINKVRLLGNEVLSTRRGDHYRPVRVTLELLNIANELAGRPFCSPEELAEEAAPVVAPPKPQASAPEAAPVMVYFDGRDHRTLTRLEDILKGRSIPYQVLDVSKDEAARSWALSVAKQPEFPVVFIAGAPVGALAEVMELDLNGGLKKKVFGENKRA
jgi:glutaredoxin